MTRDSQARELGQAKERSPGSERPYKRARQGEGSSEASRSSQEPKRTVPASDDASGARAANARIQAKERNSGDQNRAKSHHNTSQSYQGLDSRPPERQRKHPKNSEGKEGMTEPRDNLAPVQHRAPEDRNKVHRDRQSEAEKGRQIRIAYEKRVEELENLLARYKRRFGDLD
ncbi:uncharacterized protein BKA78DRAFT_307458 [Phyllosticta capitalensis]|uniref:uncharacterized protein n=1 Tax=Phyllosticta capitalensis TaxID=121624 RepID=UPI00312D713D